MIKKKALIIIALTICLSAPGSSSAKCSFDTIDKLRDEIKIISLILHDLYYIRASNARLLGTSYQPTKDELKQNDLDIHRFERDLRNHKRTLYDNCGIDPN